MLSRGASFLKIENAVVLWNEHNHVFPRVHHFGFGHLAKLVFPFGANVAPGLGLSDMRRLKIHRRERRISRVSARQGAACVKSGTPK